MGFHGNIKALVKPQITICNLKGNYTMINVYAKAIGNTWFGLAYIGKGIVATTLGYDKETTLDNLTNSLSPNADYQIVETASDFAEKALLKMREVHIGGTPYTDFTLVTEYLPEPIARVLKAAAHIPPGYVASYGCIAKAAGTEPRVVGQIMASNPLYPIVQCHRVVGTDYSLVGYGGRKSPKALKVKLARLDTERKGYKQEKEITVNGTKLTVYPVEYVIDKAKRQGLSPSTKGQRTLTYY